MGRKVERILSGEKMDACGVPGALDSDSDGGEDDAATGEGFSEGRKIVPSAYSAKSMASKMRSMRGPKKPQLERVSRSPGGMI